MSIRHTRSSMALGKPAIQEAIRICSSSIAPTRQFHRTAKLQDNDPRAAPAPPQTRRARSFAASQAIQSLAPSTTSRIDARSLAAGSSRTQPRPLIRRVVMPNNAPRNAPRNAPGNVITPTRGPFIRRSGPPGRTGAPFNRGGPAGGRPGGRGRGRGPRQGRPRGRKRRDEAGGEGEEGSAPEFKESDIPDETIKMLLEKHRAQYAGTPFTPTLPPKDELLAMGSSTLATSRGAADLLEERLRRVSGRRHMEWAGHMGLGGRISQHKITKFVSEDEKTAVLKWMGQKGNMWKPIPEPVREETMRRIIKGDYSCKGTVIGLGREIDWVNTATEALNQNQSYHDGERNMFMHRVRTLLKVPGQVRVTVGTPTGNQAPKGEKAAAAA